MTKAPLPASGFLANLPLFRELPPGDLLRIADAATEISAPSGTVVFQRGDACRGFHVVVYGQIKLALPGSQGSEKVIEIIGPGQSFGEAVMFLEQPYYVTAQCLADSKLLHIDRDAVFYEIDRDPKFARRMLAGLSRRLHHLVADIEAVSLRSGTQRVIGYLLNDADPDGSEVSRRIVLPTKKRVIASRLNLTQEHFSRILHELTAAGLIAVEGRTIVVPDVAGLRAYGL